MGLCLSSRKRKQVRFNERSSFKRNHSSSDSEATEFVSSIKSSDVKLPNVSYAPTSFTGNDSNKVLMHTDKEKPSFKSVKPEYFELENEKDFDKDLFEKPSMPIR